MATKARSRRLDVLGASPSAAGCGAACPPRHAGARDCNDLPPAISFRYLRVAVTDRCNLRCVYCMPQQGVTFMPRGEMLTLEEHARIVRTLAAVGIRKVRITGGEPLLRRDLTKLVGEIAELPQIRELALTTNGLLLARHAAPLAAAGLQRVNVSLDSLDPDRFERVTRGGRLADVLAGIEAAASAGLSPVKVNVVVMRGWNDDELPAFAELALRTPVDVRFIERMPVGDLASLGSFMSEAQMRSALADYDLEDLPETGAPARRVRIRRGAQQGTLGFISAMSRPFCAGCDRLRLTPEGRLRACLFERAGVDVREILRTGGSDEDVREAFFAAAHMRRPGLHGASIDTGAMNAVGG